MSTPPFNGTWRFEQVGPDADPLTPTLTNLARRYNLAVEGLTEEQFVEALRQAIWSGDFQCHVLAGANRMSVCYVPGWQAARQRDRVAELETLLDARCPGWRDA